MQCFAAPNLALVMTMNSYVHTRSVRMDRSQTDTFTFIAHLTRTQNSHGTFA